MWQIIINGPGYFDTAYALPEGVTRLGRADENDIVLNGDLVSRLHARLVATPTELRLEDTGSRNGLKVNGHPMEGELALTAGDVIAVGENTLSVRQPDAGERAITETAHLSASGVRLITQEEQDLSSAVLLSRDVSGAAVLRALDNFAPQSFEAAFGKEPTPPKVPYSALLLLFKTAEALASATRLSTFLESTMDHLLERTEATTAVVLLGQEGALVPAAVRHRGTPPRGEVPVSDAIVAQTLRDGKALVVADTREDPRFAERESVVLYGAQRVVCLPLGAEAPFLGVLYLSATDRGETALEVLLDTCAALAHLVSAGIAKLDPQAASAEGLRWSLARHHSPELTARRVEDAQRQGGRLPGLEEKGSVTALYAELVGVEEVARKAGLAAATTLLEEFQSRMSGLVFSFDGSLEALSGEGMRAVFGLPISKPDDALRAVRAALALKVEWERAQAKKPEVERCGLRMGLHTGRGWAGMVGPASRPSFVGVGEAMRVANEVTALGKAGQIWVTAKTLTAIGARFDAVPLGERSLRGALPKLALFEVVEEDLGHSTLSGL